MEEVLDTYEHPYDAQHAVVRMEPVQLLKETRVPLAATTEDLYRVDYEDERATLVLDSLNKHTKGAFHAAFEPFRVRDLLRRIEFCHTPKRSSWVNIEENELSAMTRPCLSVRSIGDLETLREEIAAWSSNVNTRQRRVDWAHEDR